MADEIIDNSGDGDIINDNWSHYSYVCSCGVHSRGKGMKQACRDVSGFPLFDRQGDGWSNIYYGMQLEGPLDYGGGGQRLFVQL